MSTSGQFVLTSQERVCWGVRAVDGLAEEAEQQGAMRDPIVTSPSLRRISTQLDELARQLMSDLGLPMRLSEADVAREQLKEVAEKPVANRWVKTNPRPIRSAEDILEILKAAF